MLRNTIRRKKQGGQHPPLWHALTQRKGRWCSGTKGRYWGQLAPQYPSVFRPYNGEKIDGLQFMDKEAFLEDVHKSQFMDVPQNFKALSQSEIQQINTHPQGSPLFPRQERGVKPACSLPYERYVNGVFDARQNAYRLSFEASNRTHGERASGSPFMVYAMNPYAGEALRTWEYAVAAGDRLEDTWSLPSFADGAYHLRVYAPNGFYREFRGDSRHPEVSVACSYKQAEPTRLSGRLLIRLRNDSGELRKVSVKDVSYKQKEQFRELAPNGHADVIIDLQQQHQWYDVQLAVEGYPVWSERFAGHIETGKVSKTDPLMGSVI